MAIQTILAVPSKGTMNMSTLATDSVRADSSTQGLALPAMQRVRSMSWPTIRLAATMRRVDTTWSTERKASSRASTSVKYLLRKLVKIPEESRAPKGPMK